MTGGFAAPTTGAGGMDVVVGDPRGPELKPGVADEDEGLP